VLPPPSLLQHTNTCSTTVASNSCNIINLNNYATKYALIKKVDYSLKTTVSQLASTTVFLQLCSLLGQLKSLALVTFVVAQRLRRLARHYLLFLLRCCSLLTYATASASTPFDAPWRLQHLNSHQLLSSCSRVVLLAV
jgi:hypothetical protein